MDLREERWKAINEARRVIIKVGSAVLTKEDGLNQEKIRELAEQVSYLVHDKNIKVAVVTSGAVAAGKKRFPQYAKQKGLPAKQALAAIGQGKLIKCYEEHFNAHGLEIAQILLTREGLSSRKRFVNAQNTLNTLLEWGIVPVINENDTVSTEELQFTDNDTLAALIVSLIDADLLVILSEIDALYDKDPREYVDAKPVKYVERVDERIMAMAGVKPGSAGRGGMKSKLLCARMVNASGVPMILASGMKDGIIARIFQGEEEGTFFKAEDRCRLHGKKPWIAYTLEREGVIIIDDGAVNAITVDEKSLLPVGVREVLGDFEENACVLCKDFKGREIAIGITYYSSDDLRKICGKKTFEIQQILGYIRHEEVIHRDNMVILEF